MSSFSWKELIEKNWAHRVPVKLGISFMNADISSEYLESRAVKLCKSCDVALLN
jgi:hypothetical protein